MAAINLENIGLGLSQVKEIAKELDNRSVYELVDTDSIFPSDDNPYKLNDTTESLSELAANIRAVGLLHPLTVWKKSESEYRIISGERRYTAIKDYLHWRKIPCTVYQNISAQQAQLMLHMANLETRSYTAAQKLAFYPKAVECIKEMIDSGEYSGALQKGIAELLGISQRQVRKYKKIAEQLSAEQRQEVISGERSINDAYDEALEKEEKPKRENPKTEIDESLLTLICNLVKEIYGAKETVSYYLFCVPTPKQAVKDFLKPDGGYSANISCNGECFIASLSRNGIEICADKEEGFVKFAQLDSIIRKLILRNQLLSREEFSNLLIEQSEV